MKHIAILVVIMLSTLHIKGQDKAELLYFGDPMCSWCYGFSPEFSQAVTELDDRVNLTLIMGGLRPFNTESMTDLKSFLSEHWEDVHARTGQKFSYDILEETTMKYDTEPACRSVVTVKAMEPELALDYFKAVQHAFYFRNKNPNITKTYADIAQSMGMDRELFVEKFESDDMKAEVKKEFQFSSELGARSFPTVILKKGSDYFLIAEGYMKAEVVEKNVLKILNDL